jgi:transposase-like protein
MEELTITAVYCMQCSTIVDVDTWKEHPCNIVATFASRCEDCGSKFTEYSNASFEYRESFMNMKKQIVTHTFQLCWDCLQKRKARVSLTIKEK